VHILVTGGAGFIGSNLIEALLKRGERVTIIDNFDPFYPEAYKISNISGFQDRQDVEFIHGDICDPELITKTFTANNIDLVIHLAAKAGVRPSLKDPVLYEKVNCLGTLNLLEACRKNDVGRFIFGSSSSVYGTNSKVPFSVGDPINKPISPYATTKRSGELMCHTFHHLYGLQITALRFFTVYGRRQRPDLAIYKFTRMIDAGKPIPMYGDGTTERDYTYIDDIVHGILCAVEKPFDFEILNLGESRTTKLKDLISIISTILGKEAVIEKQPLQPGDVPITYADIELTRQKLGYDPQVDLEEGIAHFIDWYKTTGRQLAEDTGMV
jgi:UDP-glucuronate 4-epimerase